MHDSDRDFYKTLCAQCAALVESERHPVPNMANVAALLWQSLEGINWAGFYTVEDGDSKDGGSYLLLGPFQGKPACIRIPWGKGVCGTAAGNDAVQLVADVHQFPGHIACDSASRSEIVVPLHSPDGRVAAVLDIDSPHPARFTEDDSEGLAALCRILEAACDW